MCSWTKIENLIQQQKQKTKTPNVYSDPKHNKSLTFLRKSKISITYVTQFWTKLFKTHLQRERPISPNDRTPPKRRGNEVKKWKVTPWTASSNGVVSPVPVENRDLKRPFLECSSESDPFLGSTEVLCLRRRRRLPLPGLPCMVGWSCHIYVLVIARAHGH